MPSTQDEAQPRADSMTAGNPPGHRKPRKVLAISAHPDDAEIGCGGTLIKHGLQGDEVTLLVVTNGAYGPGKTSERLAEQAAAAEIMGIHNLVWGNLPDCEVSLHEFRLVQLIEGVLHEMGGADFIYTHDINDSHQDHRTTALCTLGAARNQGTVLCYDAPSSFGFLPTVFVDIADVLEKKVEALLCHPSQIAASEMVDTERIRAQARVRGHDSRLLAAEAFVPKRLVLTL